MIFYARNLVGGSSGLLFFNLTLVQSRGGRRTWGGSWRWADSSERWSRASGCYIKVILMPSTSMSQDSKLPSSIIIHFGFEPIRYIIIQIVLSFLLFILLVIIINVINWRPLGSNIQSQAMGGKVQKRSFWDKNMIREGFGGQFLKELRYSLLNGRGIAKNERHILVLQLI